MALDPFWLVQFLKACLLLFSQLDLIRIQSFHHSVDTVKPRDWTSNPRTNPSQRYLNHLATSILRNFLNAANDNRAPLFGFVPFGLGSHDILVIRRPGKTASVQWLPRNDSNTGDVAILDYLPFSLTIREAVMILHRHELRPFIPLGTSLHHDKLVGERGACTDEPHLSTLY